MAKQVLVPMKRNHRVEDFIPYVEDVARPGMKVVFMVPYPVDGLRWSNEEFGRKAIAEGRRLASYYAWDTNVKKATERISPALEILPSKGIEVSVELYAGNLRGAIAGCTAKGDVHLIVTRAGIAQKIAALLNGSSSLFDLFQRPTRAPILLIRAGATA